MTLQPGPAARLTIYLRLNARHGHVPVHTEIVRRAHAAGLAGASVFTGDEGFGRSATIHQPRLLTGTGERPCAVVIVEAEDRLRDFLPQVEEILEDGVAFLQPVEVLGYVGGETP